MYRAISAEHTDKMAQQKRQSVLYILIGMTLLATVAVPFSVVRASYTGWLHNYTFHIIALLLGALTTLFRKKLATETILHVVLFVAGGISIGDLLLYGLMGNGVIWACFAFYILMQFYSKKTMVSIMGLILSAYFWSFTSFCMLEQTLQFEATDFLSSIPSWGANFFGSALFLALIFHLSKVHREATERLHNELKERSDKLEKSNRELENALTEITTLQGVIPICAECHSIRDDKGAWEQMERYISNHSNAVFSHSICEKCAK